MIILPMPMMIPPRRRSPRDEEVLIRWWEILLILTCAALFVVLAVSVVLWALDNTIGGAEYTLLSMLLREAAYAWALLHRLW